MLGYRLVLVLLFVLAAPAAALSLTGSEALYRCDGRTPLYTNKASYGCEAYRPRDLVAVSPNATMFFGHGPGPSTGAIDADRLAASIDEGQARLCQLYDEWIALNEQTLGGLYYKNTAQTVRMQTLAKIFSAIGIPAQYCGR